METLPSTNRIPAGCPITPSRQLLQNTEAQYGAKYTGFQAANICAWLDTVDVDILDALSAALWEIELPWGCNLPRIEHYKKAWDIVRTAKAQEAPAAYQRYIPEDTTMSEEQKLENREAAAKIMADLLKKMLYRSEAEMKMRFAEEAKG
jgi:hypothetical protein